MRDLILAGVALAVTLALASPAAAQEAEESVEYVVWVDALNLRAEPTDDADVLKVLKRGTRVENLSEVVAEVEGRYWRQVKAAGKTGWVPDRKVLPDYFYDPFKKADELGRAGDAEGMVAAVIEGNKKVGYSERDEGYCYRVSPDRRKVLVSLRFGVPRYWGRGYPDLTYDCQPEPVLYFVNGRGLVEYLQYGIYISGEWFPDSRHYAFPGELLGKGSYPCHMILLDTERWEETDLGGGNYDNERGCYEYELINGYLIWLSREQVEGDVPAPLLEDSSIPVLLACDVATRKVYRLLRADMDSLIDEPYEFYRDSQVRYKIKLVPDEALPGASTGSVLYDKYNGAYNWAHKW